MVGIESGQRINLDKTWFTFVVEANIGAAGIAAAENAVGGERRLCRRLRHRAGGKMVPHPFEVAVLVFKAVHFRIGGVQEFDLHDAKDSRGVSGADNDDGEFPPGQKFLD